MYLKEIQQPGGYNCMPHNQKLKLFVLAFVILSAACSSKEYTDRLHYIAASDPDFKPSDKIAPVDLREYLIDLRMEEKTNYHLLLLAQTPPGAKEILFVADTKRDDAGTITFSEAEEETEARIPDGRSISAARIGKADSEFKLGQDKNPLSARLFARSRIAREETKLYRYSVSWPEFTTSNAALNTAINAVAASLAQGETLADFIKLAKTDRNDADKAYWLDIGYTVTLLNDRFVSVLFMGNVYTGGAHPNRWTDSIVFAINGGIAERIELNGYVINGDKQDDLVSLMRAKLQEQKASLTDDFAADDATFTFAPGGIQFWFDPYIAGPYSEGFHKIFLTWDELRAYLIPDTMGVEMLPHINP
jgi:hypothetical protein